MGFGLGSTTSGQTGNYYGSAGTFNPWAQEYQQALNQMISKAGSTIVPGGGGNVETPQYAAAHGNGAGYGTSSGGNGFGTQAGYQPLPAYQLYDLTNQAESHLPSNLQINPQAQAAAGQTASDQYMRNVVNPGVASSIEQSEANGAGNSTFAAGAASALQANGAANAQQVNNQAQNAWANTQEGLRSSYFQSAANNPNSSGTDYNQFGLGQLGNNVAQGQLGVSQGQLGVSQGQLGLQQQNQQFNQNMQNRQFGLQQGAAIGGAIGSAFGF